jgi:tetratricopeptide (TPR) repeat protein
MKDNRMENLAIAREVREVDLNGLLAAALDHHRAGRRDAAEPLYQRVLTVDPDEPTALYLFGLMNFEAGRPDRAERLLERLAEVRPDHAEANVALANIRYWRGRYGPAVEGYRRTLDLQPNHPGALINLAAALRDQGDFDGATQAYRVAIARLDDPAPAHAGLGGALIAAGRFAASADAYRAALALDPELAGARAGLALALLNAGRIDDALSAAEAALDQNPDSGDAWLVKGGALSALRRPAEAVVALLRTVELEPMRATAHLNLGNAYAELQQADEAVTHLQRAVELEPGLKEGHASLGSVCLLVGETEAAERHCWLALAIDPDMVGAHQNLAAIYAEKGEAARARHHRDMAYGRQNVFVNTAVHADASVLVLTTSQGGNVPHKFLLPADRYTRVDWFIEYASPGQAEQLPPYDAVFNAIGDPDLAGPTDAPVARFLDVCTRPLFNRPDRVARTGRQQIPALLADIPGVVAPAAARLGAADLECGGLAAAVARAGLTAPVLVRPIGSHGGKGLIRALSEAELDAVDLNGAREVYATAYRDFVSADGLYRKYRTIFVDRRAYPYHLAIGDDWLVHYESAPMADHPARRDEELAYLADPAAAIGPAAVAAVAAIGRRLDLDFCGVDFSILPDGSVLVFEANATMLVHPEAGDSVFAAKNPYAKAIIDAFQAMLAGG